MSDDDPLAELRDQLVFGGHRRRRIEQRRRALFVIVPVVVALVVGVVLFARTDSGSDTAVSSAPRPKVISACTALLDLRSALNLSDQEGVDNARRDFAVRAGRSGDRTLVRQGPRVLSRRHPASFRRAEARCRALAVPDYNPRFLPPAVGPEPSVPLDAYGTVRLLEPFDGNIPPGLRQISGKHLSEVEAAGTTTGAYTARWSYSAVDGTRLECVTVGGPNDQSYRCGTGETRLAPGAVITGMTNAGSLRSPVVGAYVSGEVSFVVLETPTHTYVQRPGSGLVAFTLDESATPGDTRLRAYDTAGNELGCTRPAPLSQACGAARGDELASASGACFADPGRWVSDDGSVFGPIVVSAPGVPTDQPDYISEACPDGPGIVGYVRSDYLFPPNSVPGTDPGARFFDVVGADGRTVIGRMDPTAAGPSRFQPVDGSDRD